MRCWHRSRQRSKRNLVARCKRGLARCRPGECRSACDLGSTRSCCGLWRWRCRPGLDLALGPFVIGLRRRLGRDQERLHLYHNDPAPRDHVRRALPLHQKVTPRRRREEERAETIGREYRAKLDDLSRQYATRVTVEWNQTLELAMPVQRFAVSIRRRKADRVIRLDWNPLIRRLEPPTCEYSASTERPRLVCDDALHLVVAAALGPCSACARAFCRACNPTRCPRCGTTEPLRRGISGAVQS